MAQYSPTHKALMYTWRQLAYRAGVIGGGPNGTGFEVLPLSVYYGRPERACNAEPGIIVIPCAEYAWHYLLTLSPNNLGWLPQNRVLPDGTTLPFADTIPVIFWGRGYEDGHKPFAERREDGTVVFYADIIATTLFMLSRWEEAIVSIRDEHGRFPATASVAYKQGFLDRPVVDEYALILREWLKVLRPGWESKPCKFSVRLSHDIDLISGFTNWGRVFRTLAGDIVKRRSLGRSIRTVRQALIKAMFPDKSQYYRDIFSLAELSRQYAFGDDTFYFMATKPGPLENDYDINSSLIKRCIYELTDQGFEIGLHPGYHTFGDGDRLLWEKGRLDSILGKTKYGARQHFLRFEVPTTWYLLKESGIIYDTTMGYSQHEGFRCGTCHPFHPFDLERNHEIDLQERPLIVMDKTLYASRSFTPKQAEKRILELARRCQYAEGVFTLLWHNTSLSGAWQSWGNTYCRVLKSLADMVK